MVFTQLKANVSIFDFPLKLRLHIELNAYRSTPSYRRAVVQTETKRCWKHCLSFSLSTFYGHLINDKYLRTENVMNPPSPHKTRRSVTRVLHVSICYKPGRHVCGSVQLDAKYVLTTAPWSLLLPENTTGLSFYDQTRCYMFSTAEYESNKPSSHLLIKNHQIAMTVVGPGTG